VETFYKLLFSIHLALCVNNSPQLLDYRRAFAGNYLRAEEKAKLIRPLFHKYGHIYDEDSDVLEAIVFPEIIRYNSLYDIIEINSLRTIYARYGEKYADFSVGLFQMKPTFAKSLEVEVLKYRNQNWVKNLGFDNISPGESYNDRILRVQRIAELSWQFKYLIAMIKSVKLVHANTWKLLSKEKKIIFLATAYNFGWNKPAHIIMKMSANSFFHLNPFDKRLQYNFASIALYRYNQLISKGL